jgi:hypothetical protein
MPPRNASTKLGGERATKNPLRLRQRAGLQTVSLAAFVKRPQADLNSAL